jgi:hypothetical protein
MSHPPLSHCFVLYEYLSYSSKETDSFFLAFGHACLLWGDSQIVSTPTPFSFFVCATLSDVKDPNTFSLSIFFSLRRRRWWPRLDFLEHYLCGLGQCCNCVSCPPSHDLSLIPIAPLESHFLTNLLVCADFSIGIERTKVETTEERTF